jgi:hypothetical protein
MERATARALAFLALFAATPALAQEPPAAETLIEAQREQLRDSAGLGACPTGPAGDDIVVCARQGRDPNRLPFDSEPAPGARRAGEIAGPRAALDSTRLSPCTTVGPNQRCSGGLPIIPIAVFVVQSTVRAVKGRDRAPVTPLPAR